MLGHHGPFNAGQILEVRFQRLLALNARKPIPTLKSESNIYDGRRPITQVV